MAKGKGMIDVGKKKKTNRTATARVTVNLPTTLIERIKNRDMPKGDVLEVARVAGIMAAKRTDEWIPLCHNIELDCVTVDFKFEKTGLMIQATVKSQAKTGVEMEALLACSTAALTVYDMSKMFSKGIVITELCLLEKRGGKTGDYQRGKA